MDLFLTFVTVLLLVTGLITCAFVSFVAYAVLQFIKPKIKTGGSREAGYFEKLDEKRARRSSAKRLRTSDKPVDTKAKPKNNRVSNNRKIK